MYAASASAPGSWRRRGPRAKRLLVPEAGDGGASARRPGQRLEGADPARSNFLAAHACAAHCWHGAGARRQHRRGGRRRRPGAATRGEPRGDGKAVEPRGEGTAVEARGDGKAVEARGGGEVGLGFLKSKKMVLYRTLRFHVDHVARTPDPNIRSKRVSSTIPLRSVLSFAGLRSVLYSLKLRITLNFTLIW